LLRTRALLQRNQCYGLIVNLDSIRLSGYLAEATGNNTYLDVAIKSATFLKDILAEAESGLVFDLIDINGCQQHSRDQSAIANGFAIQAWSIIANISHDPQWGDMYVI
jgi:hypothetical protein